MVNFNISYKKKYVIERDTLVYKHLNYNKIFTESLVNYMEALTLLNVKRFNLNTTIFVIDEEFKEFGKLYLRKSQHEFFFCKIRKFF